MPGRRASEQPLKTWYNVARKAEWKNPADLKADYGANVDLVYGKYVFDVHGNNYRLVCSIDFARHGVLVLWVDSHAEYDELNERKGEKLRRL